jgi:hypothetical protein
VTEDTPSSNLSRLVSVPGLAALAVLGVLIVGVSRLFGTEVVLREVLMEVIASFGSALLILAVFGLFFRSGIERLIRHVPGGDLYEQSTDRLRELLEARGEGEPGHSGLEERLARIEQSVDGLSDTELPALRSEVRELRDLILGLRQRLDA